jgi:hypothetical protein
MPLHPCPFFCVLFLGSSNYNYQDKAWSSRKSVLGFPGCPFHTLGAGQPLYVRTLKWFGGIHESVMNTGWQRLKCAGLPVPFFCTLLFSDVVGCVETFGLWFSTGVAVQAQLGSLDPQTGSPDPHCPPPHSPPLPCLTGVCFMESFAGGLG